MTGIALVTVLLVNLDKVLLSKLLTLERYGYYMVGASAASGIHMFVAPFYIAAFPRFSQMVAAGDGERVAKLYHLLCQTVAVVVLPVVAVVAMFSPEALMIWTRNPAIVENSRLFVTLLVIGTGLNGLMNIPYAFQLANGWTKLAFYQNVVSVIVVVPALIISTRLYGGVGAAVIWVALNASWVLITPHIMHRRLLVAEKWRWYVGDVAIPLFGVAVAAGVVRLLVPLEVLGLWTQFLVMGATWALAVATAVFLAPSVREKLLKMLESYGKMQNV
jgi:O-antigen/teichoic acid export membrane protein